MNSLSFASTILLTSPAPDHPRLNQIRREQENIQQVLHTRERMGTCKVDRVPETDLVAALAGYERKDRVAVLHLYPDEDSLHAPPSNEILTTFREALASYPQLNLIILSEPVPSWLFQVIFEAKVPAVLISPKKRKKYLKRFYRSIAKGANIHTTLLELPAINWEVVQEGDYLPNSFFEASDQPIAPGLYYKEGQMDSLTWQTRDPVKIELSKSRWAISRRKRWGLRIFVTTLLLLLAVLVALFVLPNMNKI